MGRNEKKYGTIGLMILTVIIIFSVVGIVIAGFRMIKKNEDARLISAADTEYNKDKEKRQEIEDHLESDGTQEANTETETKGESEEAASDLSLIHIQMCIRDRYIGRGLANIRSGGNTFSSIKGQEALGNVGIMQFDSRVFAVGGFPGIPIAAILFLILAVIAAFVLKKTPFGWHILATVSYTHLIKDEL